MGVDVAITLLAIFGVVSMRLVVFPAVSVVLDGFMCFGALFCTFSI